jgi:hypothetical protein
LIALQEIGPAKWLIHIAQVKDRRSPLLGERTSSTAGWAVRRATVKIISVIVARVTLRKLVTQASTVTLRIDRTETR